jgi:signal peptidase I
VSKVTKDQFENLKTILNIKGSHTTTISGRSMTPLIRDGQEVTVKPLKTEPKKFDIIVIWSQEQLVCHYVWHINEMINTEQKILVTRGYNQGDDLPVNEKNILGKIEGVKIPFFYKLQKIFFS